MQLDLILVCFYLHHFIYWVKAEEEDDDDDEEEGEEEEATTLADCQTGLLPLSVKYHFGSDIASWSRL